MSTAAGSTNWELRLKDYVSSGLDKLKQHAQGTQNKIKEFSGALDKAGKSSVAAGNLIGRSFSEQEKIIDHLNQRLDRSKNILHQKQYAKAIYESNAALEKQRKAIEYKPAFFSKAGFQSGMAQTPMLGGVMSTISNPYMLVATGVVAVGAALKKATDMALDWEVGMAKINGTAQLTDVELGKLSSKLLALASHSGGNFDLITGSYEKILSITGNAKQSLDIMDVSIKGAKAGFADLDVVGSSIARTMSALGSSGPAAKELLDTFMMAKNVGAGEFKDFAQYMPGLIANAGAVGYKYKDAVALYSTLTKTFDPANAAMYAENVLTAFKKVDFIDAIGSGIRRGKITGKIRNINALKGVDGIKMFDEKGNRRGMEVVLRDIAKLKQTMSPKEFTYYLKNISLVDAQASTGIAALTGNLENLDLVFGGLNKSMGEANRQLKMTHNRMRNWGDITDQLKSWTVSFGNFALPAVDSLMNKMQEIVIQAKMLKRIFNSFTDDGKADAARDKAAGNWAAGEYRKKFGYSYVPKAWNGQKGEDFYKEKKDSFRELMDAHRDGKHVESAFEKNLRLQNEGKGNGDDGSKTTNLDGSISGEKGRILTMNLKMTNVFNGEDSTNVSKIKQIISDAIVDAARDALVTVGV